MDPTQFSQLMDGLTVINGNVIAIAHSCWFCAGVLAMILISDLLDFLG